MITANAPKVGGSRILESHIIVRGMEIYNPTTTGQGTTPLSNVSPANPVGPAITTKGLNVYVKNARGNVYRAGVGGDVNYLPAPNSQAIHSGKTFQGGSRAFGNSIVLYSPTVGANAVVGSVKVAGAKGTIRIDDTLKGNPARRAPNPVVGFPGTQMFRQYHGGQAHLPGYKRNKQGKNG